MNSTNNRASTKRSSFKRMSILLAKKNEDQLQLFNSYKIEQIEELRQIFKMYDRDGTGNISSRTLKFLLRGLGDNVNQQQVDIVLRDMDEDQNGTIDFQEFLLYMLEKVNKQCLEDDIIDICKIVDKEGTGYFTKNQLHILTRGKNCFNQVEEFFQLNDLECEGQINYQACFNHSLKK